MRPAREQIFQFSEKKKMKRSERYNDDLLLAFEWTTSATIISFRFPISHLSFSLPARLPAYLAVCLSTCLPGRQHWRAQVSTGTGSGTGGRRSTRTQRCASAAESQAAGVDEGNANFKSGLWRAV